MKRILVLGLVLALAACTCGAKNQASEAEGKAAANFARIKDSPPRLRMFLAAMPKGADLHIHLSGADYAESNIAAGVTAGDCLDLSSQKIVKPPCDAAKSLPPLSDVVQNQGLYARAIDGQSMRNFVPAPGLSAHDQFFDSFAKFGGSRQTGPMLAEVLNRAGRQKVHRVEVMITFGSAAIWTLANSVPWTGSFATQLAELEKKGLADLVAPARAEVDAAVAAARKAMDCDGTAPQPGCAVSLGFLQQITRTAPPEVVAAQTAFAFLLAAADPRVAGINIVAPEDSFVALRDYSLHMAMIGAMARRYPRVGVALHAGELTLGLVPPEQLRSHIREAVEVGHAGRIGHGVDVMYEDDPLGLLHRMAERHVAVEINLTSNDDILGVKGADHPFPVYRQEGVPTVLSTDDEGVARIDLTHEYQRAAQEFGLGYGDLKALSRRSLEYAFLPGASLWADTAKWTMVPACATPQGDSCTSFLTASDKARAEWGLEDDFHQFEAEAGR